MRLTASVAAASVGPVLPAETSASARPSPTAAAAWTIDASRRDAHGGHRVLPRLDRLRCVDELGVRSRGVGDLGRPGRTGARAARSGRRLRRLRPAPGRRRSRRPRSLVVCVDPGLLHDDLAAGVGTAVRADPVRPPRRVAARAVAEARGLDLVLRAALVRPRMGLSLLGNGHEGGKDSLPRTPARLASAHVRLRDRRRRLGRLRAGQPPQRGPGRLGPAPRGRRTGHERARPPARGLLRALPDGPGLGPLDDLRAVRERPPHLPPARPGARRLLVDQRDDLHARQPARLRRVGSRAGPGTSCCPTSSAPRTTSAGRASSTGPAARSP